MAFSSLFSFTQRFRKSKSLGNTLRRSPPTRGLLGERLEDRCVLTALVFDSVILANSDSTGAYSYTAATDAAGNTYMAGQFLGTMDFDRNASHSGDSDVLTARGYSDAFVAKYSPQGQYLWARRMGGDSTLSSDDLVQCMAIDNADNVYIGGKFAQNADFGPQILNSVGNTDAFVAKLDGNGNFLWANGWGTEVGEYVADLVVDLSGKVTAVTSTSWVVSGFVRQIELRQFDAIGSSTWTAQFASGDSANALSVQRAADGTLFVAGNFKGTVDLDPGAGEHWVTGSSTTNNGFVLSLSDGGELQWAAPLISDTSQDANSSIVILDMAFGEDGSIALIGGYQGQADIDPGSGVFPLPNAQTGRSYFAKLSPTGELLTAATYDGQLQLASLAAVSGGFAVATMIGPSSYNPVPGVSFSGIGGSNDIAILELAGNGTVVWAGQLGGAGMDVSFGMDSDGSGGALLTGFSSSLLMDYDPDPNRAVTASNPRFADAFVLKLKPLGDTKFYVVNDATTNRNYEYDASGGPVQDYTLNSGNTTPRGAASTIAGDKVWIVDANKNVYVYNTSGGLLGSWSAGSLPSNANVQGITTNGTDVWLVDSQGDKVYKYTGAATRLSGSQNAASSFNLNTSNKDATDLVTDGSSIWVLNNSSTDKIFKYTVNGSLLGSWTISGAGGTPTGLTIDPSNVSSIWIVDSSTDRIYEFATATTRTSGSQSPATSFPLSSTNTNPQGLADPPAGLSAAVRLPSSTNVDSSFDSALLAIIGELDGLLTIGKKRK